MRPGGHFFLPNGNTRLRIERTINSTATDVKRASQRTLTLHTFPRAPNNALLESIATYLIPPSTDFYTDRNR